MNNILVSAAGESCQASKICTPQYGRMAFSRYQSSIGFQWWSGGHKREDIVCSRCGCWNEYVGTTSVHDAPRAQETCV